MSNKNTTSTTINNSQEPENPPVRVEVKHARPMGQTFESRIQEFKSNGTTNQKNLIFSLEEYIDKMAPSKPMDFDTGARHQYSLWKALEMVLVKAPREEFAVLWNIVLMYFHKYGAERDVLGERFVHRFSPNWAYSVIELENLEKTINLIRLTADPATRSRKLREVKFSLMFSNQYPQEAAERLTAFYAVT